MKPFGLKPFTAGVAALAATSHLFKAHAAPVKASLSKTTTLPHAKADNAARDLSDVDWSTVDYSGVDWSKIDWNTVKYDFPASTSAVALPVPTTTAAVQPPPAPTTTSIAPPPPVPTTLVTLAPAPKPTTSQQAAPAPSGLAYNVGLNPSAFSITVVNRGGNEFNVAFFENTAPFQPTFSTTSSAPLQPGNNVTLTVAQGWAGRAQKLLAGPGDPATWPEISFVGGTWYDVSYIRGNNGPAVVSTPNGGVAGTSQNFYAGAPAAGKVKDSSGNDVLDATESYTNTVNDALVSYYRANNDGNGYVRNFDNGAVRTGASTNVIVELY